MAQIKTGTVSVTNGSNVVTGSGTQFLTDGVVVGAGFILQLSSGVNGAGVYYTIGGSITETGFQLSSNWAGDSASGVAYVIHIDFIAPGFPALLPGDLEVKSLLNQALQKLINAEGIAGATTTAPGIVEFATEAEDIAGLLSNRASTPNGVRKFVAQYGPGNNNLTYLGGAVNPDALTVIGVYLGGFTGTPTPSATSYLEVVGASNAGTRATQLWRTVSGNVTYSRQLFGGVWTPWKPDDPQTLGLGVNLGGAGLSFATWDALLASTETRFTQVFDTPGGVPGTRYVISLRGSGDDTGFDIAARGINNEISVRSVLTGVGEDWSNLYHAGNILGTVSHSGGVPTGAIIERGSNANGEYVKFADGTVDFWNNSIVSDDGDTISTPITLVGTYNISYTEISTSPSVNFGVLTRGSTSFQIRAFDGGSPASAVNYTYSGKGRWY